MRNGASSLPSPSHHVLSSAHGVAARPVAGVTLRRGCPTWQLYVGGSFVAYTDQVLTCADCGIDFVFSASEQEFFAQKGFTSAPKRCSSCRAQRRATGGGGGPSDAGGNTGGGGVRARGGARLSRFLLGWRVRMMGARRANDRSGIDRLSRSGSSRPAPPQPPGLD